MADTDFVKPDNDEGTPKVEDDDLVEETVDLEFYDKTLPDNIFDTLYLARVPKYMWEAWEKLIDRLGDDDEVQIGTLRTWNEPGEGDAPDVTKLRMLLQANCPEHQMLPLEYDLEVLDRDVKNHFVFSEEDLPSYKAKNKARQEAINAGIPAHLLRTKNEGASASGSGSGGSGGRQTYDRRSRYQPYYRKAIPSEYCRLQSDR